MTPTPWPEAYFELLLLFSHQNFPLFILQVGVPFGCVKKSGPTVVANDSSLIMFAASPSTSRSNNCVHSYTSALI